MNNVLARAIGVNLYLDEITADVKFTFKDSDEIVPAHKSILSINSLVFDTMFYGSLPENGDIPIADASPAAFEEFLQFFYLTTFELTSENIFDVANLCKKYQVTDNAFKLCEYQMQKSLSIINMCTGYAVALLLEMHGVIQYCERLIKVKATKILKSDDFLNCDEQLLEKILQLVTVSPKCSASVIVDACMAWAKVKCQRKNLEQTPANLNLQLKGLLHRIPFDELHPDQFAQHCESNNHFLDKDDLEAIIVKMLAKQARAIDIDKEEVFTFNLITSSNSPLRANE